MVFLKLDALPRSVLLIFVVGVAVHFASAIFIFITHPNFPSAESDQYGYHALALNLLDHGSFSMLPPPEAKPMLIRTPGYPTFLAGLYALDRSNVLVLIVQQILMVLSALMAYFLMRRFGAGPVVAGVLFMFLMFEPMAWLYSLQTMTEALGLFVTTLALSVAVFYQSPSFVRSFSVGVLLGLLPLVKPNLLFFVPLIGALYVVPLSTRLRTKLAHVGVVLVAALLVIVPWIWRNYEVAHAPILSSSPAVNFIVGFGTLEESTRISTGVPIGDICCHLPYWDAPLYPELVAMQKAILEREGIPQLIWKQIVYAPRVFFDQEFYKVFAQKAGVPAGYAGIAIGVVQVLLLILISIGLFILLKQKKITPALVFFFMIASVVFLNVRVSYSRMLIPLYPVFTILAGIALTELIAFLRKKPSSGTPAV